MNITSEIERNSRLALLKTRRIERALTWLLTQKLQEGLFIDGDASWTDIQKVAEKRAEETKLAVERIFATGDPFEPPPVEEPPTAVPDRVTS